MSLLDFSNRELLIRSYSYALLHVYGIMTIDEAVAAFNHYEDNPLTPDELIAAIKKRDRDHESIVPVYDEKNQRLLDINLSHIRREIPEIIDDLLDARSDLEIFYPNKNQLLEYCEQYPWSTTNAWEIFIKAGRDRHYLKQSNEYVEFCWQYFHYIQISFGAINDETDPSSWFISSMHIIDPAEREKVQRLAKRMFFGTRLWSEYGRSPAECMRSECVKAGDSEEELKKIDAFLTDILTDEDMEFASTPQKTSSEKIPRNAPCPCGSGKKYKNCCGRNS